jgi:hypothetical protein
MERRIGSAPASHGVHRQRTVVPSPHENSVMGYFRRPIDRARCQREAASLAEQPLPEIPWEKIPRAPPPRTGLVRFSTLVKDRTSGRRAGFLTFSYDVLKRSDLDPSTGEGLRVARNWFNEHLPGPDVFEDKAIWFFKAEAEDKAIWFFKAEAKACMAAAWELTHWLEEAGVLVEMQSLAHRPGRICYEDEHQIAIVPHADSRVR